MVTNVYVTIDIGEHKSKMLVSTVANKEVAVCAAFQCDTIGVKGGQIVSKIDFQKTVSTLLTQAHDAGYDIKEAIIVLPSTHLSIYHKRATQEIASNNRLVTERDIDLLQRACARHQLSSDDMVVGIDPINYSIAQNEVIDLGKEAPIGYRARTVTLDAFILVLPKLIAKSYTETLEGLGIMVLDAIVAPNAHSYLLLTEEERRQGALILDIGAYQSNLTFIKNNLLTTHFKIKGGSELISEKLAELLNVDRKTGESIKIKYGNAVASMCSEIGVYLNPMNQTYIKEVEIGLICENALETIINEMKRTIDLHLLEQNLPLYITGGGANLPNIAMKISRGLGLKSSVRQVALIGARDPIFNACLGAAIHHVTQENKG